MATHSCTAADLPALFKQLETARIQRVGDAMFEAAQAGVSVLVKAAPNDQGELRRSISAQRMGQGAARDLIDAPHAGIVELGSRPHWAPLQPLVEWVARHQRFFRAGWRKQRKIKRDLARAKKMVSRDIARTDRMLTRDLVKTQRLASRHLKEAGKALTRRRRYGFGLTKHEVFMAHAGRAKALMSRHRALQLEIRRNRGRGR